MLQLSPPDYKFCPMCANTLLDRKCDRCGWVYYPHVFGAAAAVIIKDGRFLLVKRKQEPYKNTWMFPAGFIEYGEHPEETMVREVREETGLRVISTKLLKVLQNPDDPRAPGHFGFFYLVTDFSGQVSSDQQEVEETGWFLLDNLPKIGWQSHNQIVNAISSEDLLLHPGATITS